MLRTIFFAVLLGFLVSCSSQPAKDETTSASSCNGDCSKNLNKIATPEKVEAVEKPAPKKKSKKTK